MKRILRGLAVAVILTLCVANPTLALDAPDYVLIDSSYVFRHLLEADDMGFFISCDVHYAGTYPTDFPTELISETIIIRLMDGATEISNVQPYAYWQLGYEKGSVFIYLTAAEVVAAGIAWNDPLTVKLVGNPLLVFVGGTPSTSESITEWYDDGVVGGTMSGQRAGLGNRILTQGIVLGLQWGSPLVSSFAGGMYYLTPSSTTDISGEDYFLQVVNSLHTMCPQIFVAQDTTPQYKTDAIPVYGYKAGLEGALVGTPLDITDSATLFGIDKMVLSSLMFAIGIIAGIIAWVSKGILAPVALLVSFIVIILGAKMGAISFYWIVLSILGGGFIIARTLFPINQ